MKKILGISISVFAILFMIMLTTDGSTRDIGDKCTMDIQCGVGKKCSDGICTGGIVPKIKGKCVRGKFGKKVCTNTGEECSNNSECWN